MAGAPKFDIKLSVTENGRKAPQWTIDSDTDGQQTLEDLLKFTKANLIYIAAYALEEEQAKGFDKNPVVEVDGRAGKPVEQVNPLGKILIIARQPLNDVLRFTYQGLLDRSRTDTGNYKASHVVLYNFRQVANSLGELESFIKSEPNFKAGDSIIFVNITPYARRLERLGASAGRVNKRYTKSRLKKGQYGPANRVVAPNGTYYLTARSVERRYGKNVKVNFKFVPGHYLGLTSEFQTTYEKPAFVGKVSKKKKKARKKTANTYLYPGLFLSLKEGGTL